MKTKLCGITIGVLFSLSGLALHGQAGSGCSGQHRLRPEPVTAVCKPIVAGTRRPSNGLPRQDDDDASYVTFEVPDALYLYPTSINNTGAVAGNYIDFAFNYHGFLRDAHGNISTIDVPGDGGGTVVSAINDTGTVAGNWCNATFTVCPGFLRDRFGNITSFDAPGDVNGTFPGAILDNGTVTGFYYDASFNEHGFLRSADGTINEFDVSGSQSTTAYSINPNRSVAGTYVDTNGHHYFERTRNGTLIPFDIPGGMGGNLGGFFGIGQVVSINPEGAITGSYFQPISGNPLGGNYQGFLRHSDGSFDTFYAADYQPCCIWTFTLDMTPDETIAGFENDGYNVNYGFIRTRDGNVTLFQAEGAGTGDGQGTVPLSMNNGRIITGFYVDSAAAYHGFLRIPH